MVNATDDAALTAHRALVDDLVRRTTGRLVDPLEILLDDPPLLGPIHDRVRGDAEMWAAQLLGSDDALATATAARLIGALYPGHPGDEAFDPPASWWASPFGRVVLRRIGHPARERVSYAAAGAMLGITRQGVHDLIARGKLRRHPDGGVTTASVRDRANRRDTDERRDTEEGRG